MAPRTAKAKKAADVKVTENEAPKKGKGKGKKDNEEVEQDVPDIAIDEKPASVPEKKTKRGKKIQEANGDAPTNESTEDAAPPAKRGRKKKEVAEPISEHKPANGDHSDDGDQPEAEEEQNGEHTESNGTEEAQPVASKGRKKAVKKEEKPKESARGRKKQASPENNEEKVVEEKPKGKGRGRKAKAEAAPEPEEGEEKTESFEEAKSEPPTKGRKKAPVKAVKETTSEVEKDSADESEKSEPQEKTEEVKKESKGKKGKKAQAKEEGVQSEEKEPASKKRKVTKKEGKGDAKDDEASEDGQDQESQEPKPAKGKRGKKADVPAAAMVETEEEPQEPDSAAKRRRKPAEEKAPQGNKKKAAIKNKAVTDYEELDFDNNSKSPQGKDWNFKISSWNVDGIRAWLGKGGLDYLKYEKPDIFCLQETKCAQDKLPDELVNVPGYHAYWLSSDKDGYAGVGIYTTQLAMNVQYGLQNKELDNEGRIITAEYEQFYLICTYVPNAGRKLVTLPRRLQWNEEFRKHVMELDKKKPVIICGDMNVAHNEIDLANPKSNRKNAGFTEEERAGMTDLLSDRMVDTFRHLYPDRTGAYTFWTYMMNSRAKNVGWRLDYFIVSERLLPAVCDNVIRDQVFGSDHCPISLFLHLTSAVKPKEE